MQHERVCPKCGAKKQSPLPWQATRGISGSKDIQHIWAGRQMLHKSLVKSSKLLGMPSLPVQILLSFKAEFKPLFFWKPPPIILHPPLMAPIRDTHSHLLLHTHWAYRTFCCLFSVLNTGLILLKGLPKCISHITLHLAPIE